MDRKSIEILIVEDDPIIAADIKSLLIGEGFSVVGKAKNGVIALDMLHSHKPNFVIVDIYLGNGPSGIDVAEVIHRKYALPYIFLTSFSDQETLKAAQDNAPYDYLVKPFQDRSLITTITTAWYAFQRLHDPGTNYHKLSIDLTIQEKNICELLLKGHSYNQICAQLNISINTLKFHVKNIYSKCNVKGRSELTALLS